MDIVTRISEALQRGDQDTVASLTAEALEHDLEPRMILDDGLIAGMDVIGERFRIHEIFLPEVLLAARAMYAGLDQIEPLLAASGIPARGKVVIGTVQSACPLC